MVSLTMIMRHLRNHTAQTPVEIPATPVSSTRLQLELRARNKKEKTYEHNQNQRWNGDLLQGLGQRTGRYVLSRLATELRRLEWSNAFPCATRFPRSRA